MNKIIALLIIGIVAVSMISACSNTETDESINSGTLEDLDSEIVEIEASLDDELLSEDEEIVIGEMI